MGRSKFRIFSALTLAWSLFLFLGANWVASCGGRSGPDRADDAATSHFSRVDPYAVKGAVAFHVVHWRICAEPVAGRPNEALGRRAVWALSKLRKARCALWTALVAPDRVLVQIPVQSWFRKSLDLILTGADDGVLVDRDGREYWQGQAEELASVLDGTGYFAPSEAAIKFLDDKPLASSGRRGLRKLEAVAERRDDCHRLVEMSIVYRPDASLRPDLSRLLLRGLSLVTGMGLDRKDFDELSKRIKGLVTEVRVRSRCASWPAWRKAVARIVTIEGSVETMSLPANRAAVPPLEAARRHGPLSPGPLAYFEPKRFEPLRSWTGKPGPTCPLLVSNKSHRSAVIFADGIPLGILSASTTMSFEGLACGYHRLTATSPIGTKSWGPLDTYVAGAWTLH